MRLFFFFTCLLLLSVWNGYGQTEPLSGLYFSSHEVTQDDRTSLNLTPSGPFKFSDGFSLEFDINFRRGDGYYGYIFRIIGNGNDNIDFVSNLASQTSTFWLVYKDQILLSYKWGDLPSFHFDKWVTVRLDINTSNNTLKLYCNEISREISVPDLGGLKDFDINFGASKINSFYSTDVCPMSVKNIRIYKPNNQLYRHWLLGKHAQAKVYDEIDNSVADVDNPIWLIDKYIQWRKLKSFHIDNLVGATTNENNKKIFFVNDTAIYSLSIEPLSMDTLVYQSGKPFSNTLGRDIVYNKYTNEIWSYDFFNIINRFSFNSSKWSNDNSQHKGSEYAHHNKFISPIDSSLVTLFGYGYYTYKGVVNIYNPDSANWKRIDRSDQISPRYLSSAGLLNRNKTKALVFGGYGSKSGRQELSPRSFYDLYSFDFNDYSFTHLWTLPSQSSPFVPSETLVVNESDNSFYTLLYNNGYYDSFMQLAQFNLDNPGYRIVGNPIPFKFRDTETWVYLFLNEGKSKLIAMVNHKDDVTLYSIAYPPLMNEDVLQEIPKKNFMSSPLLYFSVISLLGFILLILYLRKKKLSATGTKSKSNEYISLTPLPVIEKSQLSSIYFFGGFQVYSKEGENITSLFPPTIKQLFILIMLNSVNKKGITSAKLDDALWYDKTGDSARNNRNVNISKLRSVLEEVGDIEVVNKSSLWRINMDEKVYCDYVEVMDLIYQSKTDLLSEKKIYTLLSILNSGDFLPNTQTDWIENYKNEFNKEIILVLSNFLNQHSINNINLQYHIADYLLSIDKLNEEALLIKCSILMQAGKQSLAKTTYDAFIQAYKELMGINYPIPFKDIHK